VGAFILQCKRLDFHYCDWAGSSKGMKYVLPPLFAVALCDANAYLLSLFLRDTLPRFAKANPSVEITVSPRPRKHPVIKGTYINGREKAICVRNLEPNSILQKAILLRDASGEKLRKETKPVKSINDSVRGIWSPYHSGPMTV